ncbi:MAG: hypothetical protein M3O28_13325 [Actinomycetota bacterium]|nr:hypothetical protein [Actinomycetota bacterium]
MPDDIADAKELGYFDLIVSVIDALDDAHRAVLGDVGELDDPDLPAWAAGVAGVSPAVADAAVAAFRNGGPLPDELVRALEPAGPGTARQR